MEDYLPFGLSDFKVEQLGFVYKDIRKQANKLK